MSVRLCGGAYGPSYPSTYVFFYTSSILKPSIMDKKKTRSLLYFAENSMRGKTTRSSSRFQGLTLTKREGELKQATLLRLLFLTLFSLQLALQAAAQGTASGNLTPPLKWQLDATIGGVQFYHAITTCNGKKVVFLKFDNRNNSAVKVSWKEVFVLQQSATKVEDLLGRKQLTVQPGETFQSNCTEQKQQELLTPRVQQVTPVDKGEIVKFSFKDIKVTK